MKINCLIGAAHAHTRFQQRTVFQLSTPKLAANNGIEKMGKNVPRTPSASIHTWLRIELIEFRPARLLCNSALCIFDCKMFVCHLFRMKNARWIKNQFLLSFSECKCTERKAVCLPRNFVIQ